MTSADDAGGDTERRRDPIYRVATCLLAFLLLPVAVLISPVNARGLACRWALAARFPRERADGLQPAVRAAFDAARARALWYAGQPIGLTDARRSAEEQSRMFAAAVRRTGSVAAARQWVLPAAESRHVTGLAMDVRPTEGASWLERNGAAYGLFRVYDNEWWHFEYHPDGPPPRLSHPGASAARRLPPDREGARMPVPACARLGDPS